jgi:hypothetical protein
MTAALVTTPFLEALFPPSRSEDSARLEPLAWHWSHWPEGPVNYDSSVDQSTVALQ